MGKNTKTIVQVNIEGVLMTTNAEGKATSFKQCRATVAQANFGLTLEEVVKGMLEDLGKEKQDQKDKNE